jgi:hypothetical protein
MSVVDPKPGAMLLDRATIARMDADDLKVVVDVAKGNDKDRRDAQRTLHRGLDQGVFGLGRHLEIRLASEMRDGEWTGRADPPPESGSENERMNVRTLLSHEPRLGDNPALTPQPSLEAIVRLHYDRMFGEGQGAIMADMYLDRIRDAAGTTTEGDAAAPTGAATAPSGPSTKEGPIDPAIARAFVANLVRTAVIAERKPQTRLQIVRAIGAGARDGSIFDANAELCRHFSQGGLLGDEIEIVAFVQTLIDGNVLSAYGDGYVVKPNEAPKDAPRPDAAKPAPEAQKRAEEPAAAKPEPKKAAPAFSLGTLLSDIGIDLRVGNMDVVSSVEKASRTGNAAPLMAGIAGILLSAVANAENKKPD